MTPAELNAAVARQTGESLREIQRRGFSLVEVPANAEPEPLRPPLVVDWDALDRRRQRGVLVCRGGRA